MIFNGIGFGLQMNLSKDNILRHSLSDVNITRSPCPHQKRLFHRWELRVFRMAKKSSPEDSYEASHSQSKASIQNFGNVQNFGWRLCLALSLEGHFDKLSDRIAACCSSVRFGKLSGRNEKNPWPRWHGLMAERTA